MRIQEFQKKFEQFAPASLAWKSDNIGLLLGSRSSNITNVMVALDVTMDVALEAKKKKANFIITHHPLVFHPVRTITPENRVGEILLYCSRNNINIFAAHTNLDSVPGGVNTALAERLGLSNVRVLSPAKESLTKIVVFVPEDHVESVAEAMHLAGAGMFTRYESCSFRSAGIGTFRGMKNAKPFIGKVGKLERVNEVKLEMFAEKWKINAVTAAMLTSHPYEEVAYDIYPLLNKNTEYGLGAIGDLRSVVSQKEFLSMVRRTLGAKALRFSGKSAAVRRVAVCGGSGSECIADAVAQGADAMVTGDVKYHTFQEFEQKILLVDAGHYETEHIVLPVLADKIRELLSLSKNTGKVFITQHRTNPVHIF